ncbi:MAG TPA: hypothetical protein VN767_27710 [Streptosporangiaceae bacterium]|nr:hypothetical protein [Streptosporangiaceae bacterium]
MRPDGDEGDTMGHGDFSADAFAAAWFWATGTPGFADGNSGMLRRGARLRDPVPTNVVISVSLDDLDGQDGDLLT